MTEEPPLETDLPSCPADDLTEAGLALQRDGFVILTDAISADVAGDLAERVLAAPQRTPGVEGYEFVVALLNHDQRFLQLAMHPTVLALARQVLGGRLEPAVNAFAWPVDDQVRLGTVDGLVAHPGSELGAWHMDSPMGQLDPQRPLPDFPIIVNAIWMLTPFRESTGATRLVPGSQHRRSLPPPVCDALPDQQICCGQAGSVLVLPNTIWHAAGANRSDQPRVAVACNYQPWWVGRLTMDMYPIRPDVWERLPPAAQGLTRHQLGWDTDFQGVVYQADSDHNERPPAPPR